MRRARTLLCAAVVALAMVIGPVTSAHAADGWQSANRTTVEYTNNVGNMCESSTGWEGLGCFAPLGEWVWLSDGSNDAPGVAMPWSVYDPGTGTYRSGIIYSLHGEGWANLNKSFPEDLGFSFRVCEYEPPSFVYNCSETTVAQT